MHSAAPWLLSPAFIFADEPTSRLDPITQRETIDLLVEHAGERGCALLLVTHDADIAANVAPGAALRMDGQRPDPDDGRARDRTT